jgi:hypothetical protein
MRLHAFLLIVALVANALVVHAAEPPEPVLPRQMPNLLPISALPASYPKDVPVPPDAKPVAAADREIGLIIVFMATGKSEPMRIFYEKALVENGFRIDGADRLGPEQGIFATKGERTLSIFFEERGDDLQVQLAHVPKPPGKP